MNLNIFDSVEALSQRVEAETGKGIRWVHAPGLPVMADIRPAGAGDDAHDIYISDGFKDPEGQHMIACKLYQVLRMFRESEGERLVPSSGKKHFNNAKMCLTLDTQDRPDLARAVNEDEIVRSWVYGVINQLISQPADYLIQKAIYENMPELIEAREAVLEQQFQDFQSALSEDVRMFSPKTIYDASLIMNGVYLQLLDRYAGTDFLNRLDSLPQKRRIERLLEATLKEDEDSPAGDRRRTDLWADALGIRDWYEWVPFGTETFGDE